MDNVVCVAVEMDYQMFRTSPSKIEWVAATLAPTMGKLWVKLDDLFGYSDKISSEPFWHQDPDEFPKRGPHDE
ncbi:MAG TPA: hypothetical protein DHW14_08800 [Clostridiales bacterium]|nr:hypothetical protein [Clostridiales bacterium]